MPHSVKVSRRRVCGRTSSFSTLVYAVVAGLLVSFISVVTSITGAPTAQAAVSDVCQAGSSAQSNLRVTPRHGKAFYIDSGITPKLDAGYVGYVVTNASASARKGLWLKISDFSGGVISLANIDDQYMSVEDLGIAGSGSESSTVYIMLKASAATTKAQSHVIRLFDKRPDLSGAQELYSCTYTFSAVKETIKASANKVSDGGDRAQDYDLTAAAIDVSNTSPQLGENIVITVEGQPGQIGQGSPPDDDVIWLTPSAISSWPTRALKLVDVSIKFEGGNDWRTTTDQVTFNDTLLITGADGLANVDQAQYVARYTFRVIGNPGSAVKIVPVAQLASGTQMKHTTTTDAGATATINFSTVSINYSLAKRATATTNLETTTVGGATYLKIPYELKLTSTSATTVYIDELVDIPSNKAIFETGTARVTDVDRTNIAIADPTFIASEANLNPRPFHFVGPFALNSSKPIILTYKMLVPAVTATYTNDAYAMVGDLKIGASASTIPQVSITTSESSTSITQETTTVTTAVEAITNPASNIDTRTATLNATIDPNGNPGTAVFQYGTSASLTSFTEVTATTPGGGTLTGSLPLSAAYTINGSLTPNTVYYFRIRVGNVYGDILSFTTAGVASTPVATTLAATGVTTTSANFQGTINPNFTPIVQVSFLWGTTNTPSTEVILFESDGTTKTTAGGGSEQAFTYAKGSLSSGQTYYFKIRACTALAGNGSCSTFVDGAVKSFNTGASSQTITFNPLTDKTYGDGSFNVSPTASSTLAVSVSSLTPDVCTVSGTTITILKVGTCTLRASQGGGTTGGITYNAAADVDQSFEVLPKTLTITAVDKSKAYGDPTPVMQNLISGFAGTDSATVSSINREFIGQSISYPANTVPPTSVGTYAISLNAAALTFTSGSAGNYQIQYQNGLYTITKAPQTITFNAPTSPVTYGASSVSMGATTTSGLAITYSVTGPCTISSGGVVTFTGAGNCVITASQSGNSNYDPATNVVRTITVDKKQLTITASSHTVSINSSAPTITPSYSSFAYGETESVLSGTLSCSTPTYDGSAAGNYPSQCSGYNATQTNYVIVYVDGTVTVASGSVVAQVITFNISSPVVYGVSPISETATADSGLPVTFTVSGPCTISGSTVSITGVGTCQITASQSGGVVGSTTYGAANPVTRNLVINPAPLTITATRSPSSTSYGSAFPSTGFTTTTLYYGDSITSVTLTFTSSSPVYNNTTNPHHAGTYVITPSAPVFSPGTSSNYTISYETATVTISPLALAVTASSHVVTEGDPVPTITPSFATFQYSDNETNLSGGSCTTAYTTSSLAGSNPSTSCSGYTSSDYTFSYTNGTVTVNASGITTYTITYSANGGSGTVPTESNRASGQTFTVQSGASLSRSGYTFSNWSCNSTPSSAGDVITVGSSNVTCVAQWNLNPSSGGGTSGGGNSNSNPAPVVEKKVEKKVAVVRLVTVATTPVKERVKVGTEATSTPTPAPTTRPTPTPTPTPTPAPTTRPTPTPTPTPSPSTPNTAPTEPQTYNGVQLSQTTVIPVSGTKEITFRGVGIAKLALKGEEVSVQAKPGFSGKTTATITVVNENEEISQITAEVLVLPVAPENPKVKVNEVIETTRISWNRSNNAVNYEVTQGDEVLCTTRFVSCNIKKVITQDPPVVVRALGRDNTASTSITATYEVAQRATGVPEIALVVNFDTAKFNLDDRDRALIRGFAADVVRYKYTEVDITGHTDSRGGIDNNVLSLNRAKSAADYLLKLVPGLKVTIGGYASTINVADNSTVAGLAANRRAEFRVVERLVTMTKQVPYTPK